MNDQTEEEDLMRLQWNDAMFTEVIILCNYDNTRQYGEALQHNTFVETLTVYDASNYTFDSELLFQFIETSQSLETCAYGSGGVPIALIDFCWQSLKALQSNI
jgi:hypothetical protein